MSSAKKFKDHYPAEPPARKDDAQRDDSSEGDKLLIKRFTQKIEDQLKRDPTAQKKAADIISALMNSK